MNRGAASLVVLMLLTGSIPALSGPDYEDYKMYREYRHDLYGLQKDITQIYVELHRGKNPQAVYQHILQTAEKTAVLIGKAESASQDLHDALQISLQDRVEIALILGLSEEQKSTLLSLGSSEKDISELMDWFLCYNDYNHQAATGFTPEQLERLTSLGFTDTHIAELQTIVQDHYTRMYTAQEMVNQHQTELLYIQTSLAIAALHVLLNLDSNEKGSDNPHRLLNAEITLLKAIQNISRNQKSLEHVRASSKQVYKAAEQRIRNGEDQYIADFFAGLQVYCGAVTALYGNPHGLAGIHVYEPILEQCVTSLERPLLHIQNTESALSISYPLTGSVGQIEEFSETNNMGVITVFVKAQDTTFLQSVLLLAAFTYTTFGTELSLQQLVSLLTVGVTVTEIVIGSAGAVLLLVITAPSVGYEWPPAVPGWIEGEEVIIIVEGSYGQAHITERAQSKDECIASSHQAILDDKYVIQEIVTHASKLFYHKDVHQYLYYYTDNAGKEWIVIVREYKNRYYQLITAYRVDCLGPYECGEKPPVQTYIDKILCDGFRLINLWR